jgi:hypothetical protein
MDQNSYIIASPDFTIQDLGDGTIYTENGKIRAERFLRTPDMEYLEKGLFSGIDPDGIGEVNYENGIITITDVNGKKFYVPESDPDFHLGYFFPEMISSMGGNSYDPTGTAYEEPRKTFFEKHPYAKKTVALGLTAGLLYLSCGCLTNPSEQREETQEPTITPTETPEPTPEITLPNTIEYCSDILGLDPKISELLSQDNYLGESIDPAEEVKLETFFENGEIIKILEKIPTNSMISSILSKYPSLEITDEQIQEIKWLNSFIDNSLEKQRFPSEYLPSDRSDILKTPFNFYIKPIDDENSYAVFIGDTNYGSLAMVDWNAVENGSETIPEIDSLIPSKNKINSNTTLADFISRGNFSIGKDTCFSIYFDKMIDKKNGNLFHQYLIGRRWIEIPEYGYSLDRNNFDISAIARKNNETYNLSVYFHPDKYDWKGKNISYTYSVGINFRTLYNGRILNTYFDESGELLLRDWFFGDEGPEGEFEKKRIYDRYGKWLFDLLFENDFLKWWYENKCKIFDPLDIDLE